MEPQTTIWKHKVATCFVERWSVKNKGNKRDLEVTNLSFQQISGFKYLGVSLNNTNYMNEEIKLCKKPALFLSRLLFRKTKKQVYTIKLI